jgi:hypothetical protein
MAASVPILDRNAATSPESLLKDAAASFTPAFRPEVLAEKTADTLPIVATFSPSAFARGMLGSSSAHV